MSYLIFAWMALFLYGLANVFGKLTSRYSIKNIWLFNFAFGLFTVIFTLPLALINHVGWPTVWGNLFLSAVFNTLFSIFYTLAIFNLDVSILGPLFTTRTAFATILGVLILRESLSWWHLSLISIIFLASIFVSFDEKLSVKGFFKKSIFYGLLMSLFLALDSVYIKKAIAEAGYWETNLFNLLLSQILLLATIPLFRKEIKTIKIKQISGISLMTLCLALGNIVANKAYAVNVSISTAIIALPASMIMVFVLSFIKPNLLEKHSLRVYLIRFISALVMIFSALKLSGWNL